MASINASTASNNFLNCPMDLCFDLDEALTLPENPGRPFADLVNCAVEELPTVTSDDVCPVCVEGFGSSNMAAGKEVPCGHVYHASCISSWLSLSNACPLCRHDVMTKP